MDSRILVEDLVVGREIDIAVLRRPDGERLVSSAIEVVVDGIFDYDTKYGGAVPDFRLPAPLADAAAKEVADAAVAIFDALGCAGVARVDFFLTEDRWLLNEVNTMPGFTESSQAPRMFAAAGLGSPSSWTCWSRTPSNPVRGAARDSIADMNERLHEWALEMYFVGAVFSVGVIEFARAGGYYRQLPYLVVFGGMLLTVALARKAPGTALAVVWSWARSRSPMASTSCSWSWPWRTPRSRWLAGEARSWLSSAVSRCPSRR